MSEPDSAQRPERLWLAGLRRAWMERSDSFRGSVGGALPRWIADRRVTGVVYAPASYEIEDVAPGLVSLFDSGAKPDASLLWDFVVADVRAASDALRATYAASDSTDGYVAVWVDPGRANDPGRAVAAARELAGDVRRANIAAALAWSPTRASVVEALVAEGIAVALSGVRDAGARDAVAAAASRGAATLRSKAEAEDADEAVAGALRPRPVFVLGGEGNGDTVLGVRVETEFALFTAGSSPARLPL